MKNRIAFATLTVDYYQVVSRPIGFFVKIKLGIKNGWNKFCLFIIGVINVWPFILLTLVLGFLVKFWRNRRKAKHAARIRNSDKS